MSIYVGNLSYDVTPDELSETFSQYGTVKRSMIPTDRDTGKSRGFGFVEMVNEEDETQAIEALDGSELMGRRIRVNKARPRENRDNQRRGGFQGA